MSRAERAKGTRGELEVAKLFRGQGFDCVRTPNSGGLHVKADLAGVTGFHIEVKRQETAMVWKWMKQAQEDAYDDAGISEPVVVFRRNGSRWLALVDAEAFAALVAAARDNGRDEE